MSQPLKKQQIIALFGEKAAAKLFSLLEPCCFPITFRAESSCDERGFPCISLYATSSVVLRDVLVEITFPTLGESLRDLGGFVSFPTPNKEILVGQGCFQSVLPGTYDAVVIATIIGSPIIPQPLIVEVPFCEIPEVSSLELNTVITGDEGLWIGYATNIYGGEVQLQYSVVEGVWLDVGAPVPTDSDPYTGVVSHGPITLVEGALYRIEGLSSTSAIIYSNIVST